MDRKTHDPGKSLVGGIFLDLVESQDQLREVQREIGRMNNKTQIEYLMKSRKQLLDRIESLRLAVAKKFPDVNPVDLSIFQCIYRVLSVYGRGVSESIIWSFECEAKAHALEIVNYPKTFNACVGKILGRKSSKEIENTILFEISNSFGLQISKRTNLADAIKLVRSSASTSEIGEDLSAKYRIK